MQAGSAEFDSLLNRMMASLHHHNDDEEIDDLPLLEHGSKFNLWTY